LSILGGSVNYICFIFKKVLVTYRFVSIDSVQQYLSVKYN
ncbi:hypothetical protein D046_6849B, partial [Vibrio parahaemolyticus V-223/04]